MSHQSQSAIRECTGAPSSMSLRMSALMLLGLLPLLCVAVSADAAGSCADFNLTAEGMVDAESMLNASEATNVTACCALCTLDPACVAFTFQVRQKSCRMTSWPRSTSSSVRVALRATARPCPTTVRTSPSTRF